MQEQVKILVAYCATCDWGSASKHQPTVELRARNHITRPREQVNEVHFVALVETAAPIRGLIALGKRL